MTYTLQKDVALVTVCDEHFLVAAGQARGKVPAVKGINRPGAYFWNLLQQKLPENDILRHTAADYHIPIEKAALALRRAAGRRGLSDHGRMILKSARLRCRGVFCGKKLVIWARFEYNRLQIEFSATLRRTLKHKRG